MKALIKMSLLSMAVAQATTVIAADADTWKGSAELGYNQSSGNSEQSSFKTRLDAERNFGKWLYNFHADGINAESDGDRSAEKYFFSNRLSYKFNKADYVFGYQSYEKDRFSGYEYQATLAAGYGRRVIDQTNQYLDLEIGPGYRFAELDNGDDENEGILRLFGHYNNKVTSNTEFDQTLNIEIGDDATITKSVSSLKVKMSDALGLRLSYTINHNDNAPQGSDSTDTETAVTVVYDF